MYIIRELEAYFIHILAAFDILAEKRTCRFFFVKNREKQPYSTSG